jgi:shikimate kinase
MNIILFGFKGAGKTYLGKLLSAELKRPFIDTDDLIVQSHGQQLSVRDIHQALGETGFRALESTVIRTLQPHPHAVIALGGGSVLDSTNIEHLQKIGRLVYLKVSFNERSFKHGTPSFADAADPVESLRKIYQQRLPIYESIPARCLDLDVLDEASCITALRSIALEDSSDGF